MSALTDYINGQYKKITRYSIGMNLTWRDKEINIEDMFNS